MTARLVSPNGGPIFFGSRPGFGLSQTFPASALNTFKIWGAGTTDRYAMAGFGFGSHRNQAAAGTNLDDAADIGTAYVEDLSGSCFASEDPRQPNERIGFGDPDFSVYRQSGISNNIVRNGDDGIDCYDAAPTSQFFNYRAMFLGNQCQSVMTSFQLGGYNNPRLYDPVSRPWESLQGPFTVGPTQTLQTFFNPSSEGVTMIALVIETGVLAPTTSSVSGWQRIPVPPDAAGYAMTVYARTASETESGSLTVPFVGSGQKVFITKGYYVNGGGSDPAAPFEAWSTLPVDGLNATAPSVSSVGPGSEAISIIVKDTTNVFTSTPAGWTVRLNQNTGHAAPFTNTTVGIAEKGLTSGGSASGTAAWGGAGLGGTGVAVTLSLARTYGLSSNATSGPVTFSGLPFQPELVLFNYCDPRGIHDQQDSGVLLVGAADGTDQWSAAVKTAFGSGITLLSAILNRATRYRRFRTDACISFIGSPAQFTPATPNNVTAALTGMTSDGFGLNIIDLVGTASVVMFAVAANPGRGAFKVGSSTQPAAGTQSFSGFGFAPEAILTCTGKTVDEAVNADIGAIAVGMSDGVSQTSGWAEAYTWKPAGAGPLYPPYNYATDDAALVIPDSAGPSVLAQASLQSLDADGFTLDWTVSDGVPRLFGWVAFACDSDPTSPPAPTTDPLTLSGPHNIVFHGTLIPNSLPGDVVSYRFQYGNDPLFITGVTTTATVPDGSGTTPVAVSQAVSNGSFNFSDHLFYYRMQAITSEGCIVSAQPLSFFHTPLVFNNRFRSEQ